MKPTYPQPRKGLPLSSSGTTPLEDSLWLYLAYDYSVGSNVEVPLEIVTYFEDGICVQPFAMCRSLPSLATRAVGGGFR